MYTLSRKLTKEAIKVADTYNFIEDKLPDSFSVFFLLFSVRLFVFLVHFNSLSFLFCPFYLSGSVCLSCSYVCLFLSVSFVFACFVSLCLSVSFCLFRFCMFCLYMSLLLYLSFSFFLSLFEILFLYGSYFVFCLSSFLSLSCLSRSLPASILMSFSICLLHLSLTYFFVSLGLFLRVYLPYFC